MKQLIANAIADLVRRTKVDGPELVEVVEDFCKLVEMWTFGTDEDRQGIIDHHHDHFGTDKAERMIKAIKECSKLINREAAE